MGCGTQTIKCILHVLNVLMGLGALILIVSITLNMSKPPLGAEYYMLFVGVVSLLAAIIGIAGICKEHVRLTIVYAGFLGISFVMQILNVFGIDSSEQARKIIEINVDKIWALGVDGMNSIQPELQCCGKTSSKDYLSLNIDIPRSCYDASNNLYTQGCVDALVELGKYSITTKLVGLAFSGIIFGFAIYLVYQFRNKQFRYNH